MSVASSPLHFEVTPALVRRFFSKSIDSESGCREWTAATCDGYGVFSVVCNDGRRRTVQAHRVSWVIGNRQPIPAGFLVRHKCNNPSCVNALHLTLGSESENRLDAIEAKGKRSRPKRYILPDEIREQVLSRIRSGDSVRGICRDFPHVPRTCLRRIASQVRGGSNCHDSS